MEMQDQALRQDSKRILNELGKSLLEAYPVADPSGDFDDLLSKLDDIEFSREIGLDQANARLCRLLSNTANQTAR